MTKLTWSQSQVIITLQLISHHFLILRKSLILNTVQISQNNHNLWYLDTSFFMCKIYALPYSCVIMNVFVLFSFWFWGLWIMPVCRFCCCFWVVSLFFLYCLLWINDSKHSIYAYIFMACPCRHLIWGCHISQLSPIIEPWWVCMLISSWLKKKKTVHDKGSGSKWRIKKLDDVPQ